MDEKLHTTYQSRIAQPIKLHRRLHQANIQFFTVKHIENVLMLAGNDLFLAESWQFCQHQAIANKHQDDSASIRLILAESE